jgi:hypothetical protein
MLLAADDPKDSFDISPDIMTYLKGIWKKEKLVPVTLMQQMMSFYEECRLLRCGAL